MNRVGIHGVGIKEEEGEQVGSCRLEPGLQMDDVRFCPAEGDNQPRTTHLSILGVYQLLILFIDCSCHLFPSFLLTLSCSFTRSTTRRSEYSAVMSSKRHCRAGVGEGGKCGAGVRLCVEAGLYSKTALWEEIALPIVGEGSIESIREVMGL